MDCLVAPCSETCGHCPIRPWGSLENICCDDSGLSDEEFAALLPRAHQAASELVSGLTGGQFGYCVDRFLPCARGCRVCVPDSCNCCVMDKLRLPLGDVCEVTRFVVAGVDQPLDTISVQVEDGVFYAVNCEHWPVEQCQAAGFFESGDIIGCNFEDNWWVEYVYGSPVPVLGQMAVEALTCQFLYACGDDPAGKCVLPQGAASVSRQGVSFQIDVDNVQLMQTGLTGVGAVDRFIAMVNPNGLRSDAAFISHPGCSVDRWTRQVVC